jgi:hypothetical protein
MTLGSARLTAGLRPFLVFLHVFMPATSFRRWSLVHLKECRGIDTSRKADRESGDALASNEWFWRVAPYTALRTRDHARLSEQRLTIRFCT